MMTTLGQIVGRIRNNPVRFSPGAAHPEERGQETGQGMVEYALILVLIAVVVIVILTVVGNQVNKVFSNISNGLGS